MSESDIGRHIISICREGAQEANHSIYLAIHTHIYRCSHWMNTSPYFPIKQDFPKKN